jgi:hypothetical protein
MAIQRKAISLEGQSVFCLLRCFAFAALIVGTVPPARAEAVARAPKVTSYCFERVTDDDRPRPICISLAHYTADVCRAIERDAAIWQLPPGFFARLIWQESQFDANAVSSAGAEGIAQFIPTTAQLQGLQNPYDPAEALARSAQYLRLLADKFGNLGLAAAAYNGGEGAAARFIAGTGYLAVETLNYVQIITGIPMDDWLVGSVEQANFDLQSNKPFETACIELAENNRVRNFEPPTGIVRPWGVQVAQFFSQATARGAFARAQARFDAVLGNEDLMLVAKRNPNFGRALRFTAEIGRDTSVDAAKLCAALRQAGGACIVVRN